MRETKGPNPTDLHVGRRVRLRRRELGVSQEGLAVRLDLTFQQIQKYERGANRVSACKLYQIGRILTAPVGYFYDGLDDPTSPDCDSYSAVWSSVSVAGLRFSRPEIILDLEPAPSDLGSPAWP